MTTREAHDGIVMNRRLANQRRRGEQVFSTLPRSSKLALFLVLAVVGFRLHELIGPAAAYLRPALITGPVALFLVSRRSKLTLFEVLSRDQVIRSVAILVAWCAVTLPLATVRGVAFASLQATAPLLLMALTFGFAPATQRSLDSSLNSFIVCGTALSAGALFFGKVIAEGRLSVTASLDPNDVAATLCLVIPIAVGGSFRHKSWKRIACVGSALLCAWIVIKTGSRGGALGLGTGLLGFALFSSGKPRIWRIVTLGAFATIGFSFAPADFKQRMATLTNLEEDYNTQVYGGRKQIWERGISYGLRNPVIGVGMGNFEVAEGERLAELGRRGKWSAAHNSFIQVFAELGVPGLLMLVSLLYSMLRVGFQWRQLVSPSGQILGRPEIIAAVIGFSTAAIFLSAAYSWALFSLVTLTSIAGRAYRNVES